jgi:hypothetical protein
MKKTGGKLKLTKITISHQTLALAAGGTVLPQVNISANGTCSKAPANCWPVVTTVGQQSCGCPPPSAPITCGCPPGGHNP